MQTKAMKRSGILRRWVAGIGGLLLVAPGSVFAQTDSSSPIRLIVETPAGNSADISARQIAKLIAESLQQNVIVENVPGASGSMAAASVARARADGLTLLYGGMTSLVYFPAAGGTVRYQPNRDFVAVAMGTVGYPVVVANPSVGAVSVRDLVEKAHRRSNELTCATGGIASVQHFICAEFARTVGIKVRFIPYKGSTAALSDTAGGQTDLAIGFTSELDAYISSGRLSPLATLSPNRAVKFPSVPTLKEAGFDALQFPAFTGFYAPAGTPKPVIERLNMHIVKALATPSMQGWLRNLNGSTIALSPAEFADYFAREQERGKRIAKENAIELN
jgi:tripartite-type tricarboxylate transporter receptor subunit TctC